MPIVRDDLGYPDKCLGTRSCSDYCAACTFFSPMDETYPLQAAKPVVMSRASAKHQKPVVQQVKKLSTLDELKQLHETMCYSNPIQVFLIVFYLAKYFNSILSRLLAESSSSKR